MEDRKREERPRSARILVVSTAAVATTVAACATSAPLADGPGLVTTIAGPIEAGTGGIEVDDAGNVYTADFGAHLNEGPIGTRVWRVSPDGEVSVFAEGLLAASGNAFDDAGDLLQANIAGNTISKIAPDGHVETYADGFHNPVGIAWSPAGELLVANCGDHSIVRVRSGSEVTVIATDSLLRCPNGLALGPGGELYASNFYNGDVVKISIDGTVTRLATLPGDNNGHLTYGNDRLYVAARGANQIYVVTLDGRVTLLAGSGARGLKDGPARDAALSLPNDLALGPHGRFLYWNDVGLGSSDTQVLTPTFVRRLELTDQQDSSSSASPRRAMP